MPDSSADSGWEDQHNEEDQPRHAEESGQDCYGVIGSIIHLVLYFYQNII